MTASISLVVRRTIRASAERLFEAWTEPKLLCRWWGPRPVTCSDASVDLRVGGSYRIGNRMPDGSVLFISGVFEIVEPPVRLTYTWLVEGKDAPDPHPSRVTVRFESQGESTEVIVVHERIDTQATRAEHEHGWLGCLEGLASLFAP